MKVRTIEYYIREVFISLRRNNWMSVASIGTVAVSLFIFGMFLMMVMNMNKLAENMESQVQINVYLLDKVDREQARDIEKDLNKGNYNPFTEIYRNEGFDDFVQKILTMMISECAREFENLPIIEDVDILRNILYSGIWLKYKMVRNNRKNIEEEKND